MRTRALAGDEATQRLAQRQDLVNQLRRQMKSRDEELKTLNRKVDEAVRSKTLMVDEMEHAGKRAASLEKELLQARREVGDAAGRRMSGGETRREVERLEREVKEQQDVIKTLRSSTREGSSGGREGYALRQQIGDLKAQLQGVQRDKERLERRAQSGTSSRDGQLASENRKLREQNDKLVKELAAFDLDFFEEIEDIKYRYNQAVAELRDYREGRR